MAATIKVRAQQEVGVASKKPRPEVKGEKMIATNLYDSKYNITSRLVAILDDYRTS